MQFLHSYPGNKRTEVKDILKYFKDQTIIIEPFCGTSSVSFNHFKNNKDKNCKYFLSDLSEELARVYNIIKEDSIEKIEKTLDSIASSITSKSAFEKLLAEFKQDNDPYKLIILKRIGIYGRIGSFSNRTTNSYERNFKLSKLQKEFIEFIKSPNVVFKHQDWKVYFEEFKDNPNAIFFLDPPYVNSDNTMYSKFKHSNIYQYMYKKDIKDFAATLIFCLEKNWIIEMLFENYIVDEYTKTYSISRKVTSHVIISNRK